MRDAVRQGFLGRAFVHEPVEEAGCERVATADPIENLEAFQTRADVEAFVTGHADAAPVVDGRAVNLPEREGAGNSIRAFVRAAISYSGISLPSTSRSRTWPTMT